MKKYLILAAAVVAMMATSCSTVKHTSTAVPVATTVVSESRATLNVADKKVSYTYRPNKAVKRGGEKNVINTAVAEALKANGNADVMVGMQYEIKKTRQLFGGVNIKYVTVTGYPATYSNFRQ